MSVTYSVEKCVGATQGPDGRWWYAMFESTIDSSVYPRKAYWGACGFGSLEQCLKRVIEYAAVCEGGALQGPHERCTPEQYIESWLHAFAQPLTLTRSTSARKVDELAGGVYCNTDEAKAQRLSDVKALLASLALGGEQTVTVDPTTPPDQLAALLNDPLTPVASWHFFDRAQCGEPGCREAAYSPKRLDAPVLPAVRAFRLPARPGEERFERDYLVGVGREAPRLAGWRYAAIEELIRRVVPAVEKEQPGAAVAAVRALRAVVRNAPEISPAQPLRVERPPEYTGRYYREVFAQLAREYDQGVPPDRAGSQVVVESEVDARSANQQGEPQVIVVTAAAVSDPDNVASRIPTSWITMADTPVIENTCNLDDEPSFGAFA